MSMMLTQPQTAGALTASGRREFVSPFDPIRGSFALVGRGGKNGIALTLSIRSGVKITGLGMGFP